MKIFECVRNIEITGSSLPYIIKMLNGDVKLAETIYGEQGAWPLEVYITNLEMRMRKNE